tara:strand:+ start:266 stop:559 length:294 start_codon:yes stop_codon:yes gene_type:complete
MEIDSTLIRDSKKALRWSLLPVASQGQMYNKKYLKSLFFIAGQSYSLSQVYHYHNVDNLENIKKRNINAWWFLGLYMSSIIDSYIDAELSSFRKRKK